MAHLSRSLILIVGVLILGVSAGPRGQGSKSSKGSHGSSSKSHSGGSSSHEDLNECLGEGVLGGANPCDANSDCVNTEGSFECRCRCGYTLNLDGTTCSDVNECNVPTICGNNAVCNNKVGSFICICQTGYEMNLLGTCVDINECLRYSELGKPHGTCMNLPGSYTCTCLNGYEKDATNACVDIDECQNWAANTCHESAECNNTPGSYTCKCPCDLDDINGDGTDCASPTSAGRLVFKAVAGKHGFAAGVDLGSPHPYDIYFNYGSLDGGWNENVPAAQQIDVTFPGHYKSADIDNWETLNIQEVDIVLYNAGGEELLRLTFDGRGSTKEDFMSLSRLISTPPWTDELPIQGPGYTEGYLFSARGDDVNRFFMRNFAIHKAYAGCGGDIGWLVMSNNAFCNQVERGIGWEAGPIPKILYSEVDTAVVWNDAVGVGEADIFAIFVKTE